MPQDNDRRRKLYDRLSEAGYYTKTYDDFNAVMDDPERGRKLYTKLNEAGYYTKPYEEFNKSFQQPLRPMTTPISGADGGALSGGQGGPSGAQQQPPTSSAYPGAQGTSSAGMGYQWDPSSSLAKAPAQQATIPTTPTDSRPPAQEPLVGMDKSRADLFRVGARVRDEARDVIEQYQVGLDTYRTLRDQGRHVEAERMNAKLSELSNASSIYKKTQDELAPKVDEQIDAIVSEATKNGVADLLTDGDVDPEKVRDRAASIATKYGFGGDYAMTKRLWDKMSDGVYAGILQPRVDELFKPKQEAITGKVWDGFTTDDVEFSNAKTSIDNILKTVQSESNAEIKGIDQALSAEAQVIRSDFDALEAQTQQEADAINANYQAGMMSQEQAEAAMNQLNDRQNQASESANRMLSSLRNKAVNLVAEANTRYNQRFMDEQRSILRGAEQRVKDAAEKFYKDFEASPEGEQMKRDLERAYAEAWKKAAGERGAAKDMISDLRYDAQSAMAGPLAAFGARFVESTVSGLGGAIKGIATSIESHDAYLLGEEMERAFILPKERSENFSDLLDARNLAQVSGQLLGGMLPSLTATAVAGAATGGAGAPVAAQLVTTALAGWGAETLDIAGRAKDNRFKETGDMAKADDAAWKSFVSQVQLLPAYVFEGLPFIKGALKSVPTRAGRVTTGGAIEFGTELLQEVPQGIADKNIAQGKDPWDNFGDILQEQYDSGELKSLMVTMAPISLLGGAPYVAGKSAKQEMADAARSFAAKVKTSDLLASGHSQWMNSVVGARGEKFANAVLASMYTGGQVNDAQYKVLQKDLNNVLAYRSEAKQIGLSQDRSNAYVAMASQAHKMEAMAEAEQSPVVKAILQQRAKEASNAALDIAKGEGSYVTIKYPDGSKMDMTVGDASRLFKDKEFLKLAAITGLGLDGVTVSGNGKEAMKAVGEFHANSIDELDRIKKEKMDRLGIAMSDNVTREQRAAAISAKLKDLKERIAAEPIDPIVRAAKGDPREDEVAVLTVQELQAMGVPADEAALILANEGIIELPEGAKVKEAPDGKLDIEVKPAKEGEEGMTKTEVIADLQSQAENILKSAGIAPMEDAGGITKSQSDGTSNEVVAEEAVDAARTESAKQPVPEVPVASPPVEAGPVGAEIAKEPTAAPTGVPEGGDPVRSEAAIAPVKDKAIERVLGGRKMIGVSDAERSTQTGEFVDKDGRTVYLRRSVQGYPMVEALVMDGNELRVVGRVNLSPKDFDSGYVVPGYGAAMNSIEVSESERRKGIGSALMQFASQSFGKPIDYNRIPKSEPVSEAMQALINSTNNEERTTAKAPAAQAPTDTGAPLGVPVGEPAATEPVAPAVISSGSGMGTTAADEYVKEWGEFMFGTKKAAAEYAKRLEAGEGGTWVAEKVGKKWRAHRTDLAPTKMQQSFEDASAERKKQSAEEAATLSSEFDARQEAFLSQYPEAEADLQRTEEKIAQGLPLTEKEVGIANDNLFRPPGYDFDENGRLVKAAAQQTSIEQAPAQAEAPVPKKKDPDQQKPSDKKPVKTGKLRTDRVIAALREVAPNLTIYAPKTAKAYAAELERIGLDGISSSWGVYDPNTNSIFLNPESPDLKQTLMHEAAHPLIAALAKNNPELFAKFHEDVMAHPDAQKYRDHAAKYKDKSEVMQAAEALAEFLGDAGAGRIKFSKDPESLWQKMVAWFKDVMAALGWDTRSIDLSNAQDVQQFAKGFEKAVRKGIKITGFTPVDADPVVQLQDDANRLVDGWYSRLDQAVAAKGSTMPAGQWKTWLEARAKEGMLSLEENKWTGLDDFLASKGSEKVTPEQVREFLNENRVRVEVKELSEREFGKSSLGEGMGIEDIGDLEPVGNTQGGATKFSQYQLHGGTNYREIAITLPGPEKYRVPSAHSMGEDADVNRLLHLRLNDRTGPNGEKILFIEELQSDWGQEGKKKGFDEQKKYDAAKRFYNEIWKPFKRGEITASQADVKFDALSKETGVSKFDIQDTGSRYGDFTSTPDNTPSAPFVTSTDAWVELGLKQAIRMAVDGGYDRIAWTTGEQQNERYDLSKQVDEIRWDEYGRDRERNVEIDLKNGADFIGLIVDGNGTVTSWFRGGAAADAMVGKKLDDVVGKDMAQRIMGAEEGQLSGDGLKVGGSGMKGFYDKILPTVAKKVSKRLGGDGVVREVGLTTSDIANKWSVRLANGSLYESTLTHRSAMDALKNGPKNHPHLDFDGAVIVKEPNTTDQQSISITDAMRERVGLGVPLMQKPTGQQAKPIGKAETAARKAAAALEKAKLKGDKLYALPIPPSVWNGAVRAMQDVIVAGGKAADAIAAAIKHIQASDWWKTKATQEEKDQVTSHLQGRVSDLETAIAAQDVANLKDNIQQARSAGAQKERSKQQEARKEFVTKVREALKPLSRRLSPKQITTIAARAAKVNPASTTSVKAFERYAEKVIKKADYADMMDAAKKYQKKAKKLSRQENIPLNHREVLKAISNVDVAMLEDPADFNALVEEYLPQFGSIEKGTYKGVATADLIDRLDKMQQEAEDARQSMMEDEDDTLAGAMAAEDTDEYLNELDEEQKQQLRDQVEAMAFGAKYALNEEYSGEALSAADQRALDTLREADVENMSTAQLIDYIKAADNIGLNDSFYGAWKVAAAAKAVSNLKKAKEAVASTPMRKAWSGKLKELYQEQFTSTSGMFRFLYGQEEGMSKFHEALGMNDLELAKTSYDKEMRLIGQNLDKFYTGLRKKYKNADSPLMIASEAIYAYVIQPVPGLDQQQSFENQKAIMQASINRMKESNKLSDQGEIAQEAFDLVVRDAKTPQEMTAAMKKNAPSAWEAVSFNSKEILMPHQEETLEFEEKFRNKAVDRGNPMYFPIKYSRVSGGKKLTPLDDVEDQRTGIGLGKPKESANLIKRKGVRNLPEGQVVNLDFRRNVLNAISKNLYDSRTSQVWQQMFEFFKLPEASKILGGRENVEFLERGLKALQDAQRRTAPQLSEWDAVLNKGLQTTRKYASQLALGKVTQIIQQPADQLVNAAANTGIEWVAKSIGEVNKAQPLLELTSIGERGELQGGTDWDNRLEKESTRLASALSGNIVERYDAATAGAQRFVMWGLTKGDVFSARTAWLAYYQKYLSENGVEVSDWNEEANLVKSGDPLRREALSYATVATDVTQGSSDPTKKAQWSQTSGNPYKNLLQLIATPFSGYTVGMRERINNDLSDIVYYGGKRMYGEDGKRTKDGERAYRAGRSLMATLMGNAAFEAARIAIAYGIISAGAEGLRMLLRSLIPDDEDKREDALAALALVFNVAHAMRVMPADVYKMVERAYRDEDSENKRSANEQDKFEKKKEIEAAKRAYTQIMQSMLVSGYVSFMDDLSVDAVNRTAYLIQAAAGELPRTKSTGAPMKYEYWIKQPQYPPLNRFGQGYDNPDLGTFSVFYSKWWQAEKQIGELLDDGASSDGREKRKKVEREPREQRVR